jgi:hypothetical protein
MKGQERELCMDQVLHSDASSGHRIGEQKTGVTGKSYSLERTQCLVVCECEHKENSKGEMKVLMRHEHNMSKGTKEA